MVSESLTMVREPSMMVTDRSTMVRRRIALLIKHLSIVKMLGCIVVIAEIFFVTEGRGPGD